MSKTERRVIRERKSKTAVAPKVQEAVSKEQEIKTEPASARPSVDEGVKMIEELRQKFEKGNMGLAETISQLKELEHKLGADGMTDRCLAELILKNKTPDLSQIFPDGIPQEARVRRQLTMEETQYLLTCFRNTWANSTRENRK